MLKFFSDAFKEIGHVVWPTPKETRTYMNYTIIVIIVMTIFLSVAGYLFRTGLQTAKNTINPGSVATTEQIQATQEAQQKAAEQAEYEKFGITATGTTVETIENTEIPTNSETPTVEVVTENTENIILPSEAEEAQTE